MATKESSKNYANFGVVVEKWERIAETWDKEAADFFEARALELMEKHEILESYTQAMGRAFFTIPFESSSPYAGLPLKYDFHDAIPGILERHDEATEHMDDPDFEDHDYLLSPEIYNQLSDAWFGIVEYMNEFDKYDDMFKLSGTGIRFDRKDGVIVKKDNW